MTIQPTRIALLRRIDGLFALEVERSNDDPPQFSERLRALSPADSQYRELLDAWQLLAAVREIQAPVLAAVRLILQSTVLDPEGDRPTLERLVVEPPPPKHTPTAANPRAYQGTKDRPPKPKRAEPRDLRPFLCVPGGQDRLVRLLTEELGDVDLPDEERGAPPGFYRGMAWFAHIMPSHYEGALAAHHALDLERDRGLRRFSAMFVGDSFGTGLSWLRLAAHVEPARRLQMLLLAKQHDCHRRDPIPAQQQLLQILNGCDGDHFARRARYALSVFAEDGDLDDAIAACELADLHEADYDLEQHRSEHGYVAPAAADSRERLQLFVDAFYEQPEREVMHLWAACCIDRTLCRELAHLTTTRLDPKTARRLGQVLANAIVYDDAQFDSWRESSSALRRFIDVAEGVDYPDKAVELLDELVWENTVGNLDAMTRLAPRVCTRPLAEENDVHEAIERLGQLSTDVLERFVQAPDRAFAVLDDECARNTDAWLISCGFDAFAKNAPAWFATMFHEHPRTLCKVARTIGLLSQPHRRAIMQQVMASPLAIDVDQTSALGLVQRFDRHGPTTTTSPIPKKLRQHMAGATDLSEQQLQRARDIVLHAWPAVLADKMQELALAHLAQNLGDADVDLAALDEQMLHALKLQVGLESNQRALRRLLRACHRGDDDYLQQHPRNQAWLQRQQPMAARWLEGITLTRTLQDGRTVTLAIERDPLEALRLGTYVGSCLGLGGRFTWSAAAVALDSNKQVVFARDENGRFLARQVQAVTEDRKLANYEVYPATKGELLELFAEFDRAMAAHLQLEIETDDAEVESLLASEWWDDGVWDLDVDPDAD